MDSIMDTMATMGTIMDTTEVTMNTTMDTIMNATEVTMNTTMDTIMNTTEVTMKTTATTTTTLSKRSNAMRQSLARPVSRSKMLSRWYEQAFQCTFEVLRLYGLQVLIVASSCPECWKEGSEHHLQFHTGVSPRRFLR